MFLQDIFLEKGYQNIVDDKSAYAENFDMEYLYDDDMVPKELLGAYISKYGDEMFLLLNSTGQDISELCNKWDKKISTFMIFGSNKKSIIEKLKYNVVQIILSEDDIIDRTQEGSLNVSRKIIVPCTFDNTGRVVINDESALEFPFVLIKANEEVQRNDIFSELSRLLPKEDSDMEFLRIPRGRKNRILGQDGVLVKSFPDEFEQIKEWLTSNDNTES